jgi:EmrB/QacA subfamily drug resistance transporter
MDTTLKEKPNKWAVLGVMAFGTIMATLDGSIVNIALPTLRTELHTGDAVQWIVLAYTIATTSTLLIMGRVADLVGRKKIYVGGYVVFTIASLLCGISWDIYSLVGFRILQGLGGSMLFSVAPAIISETFEPHERGKALGIMGSSVALGSSLGPVIGGFLLEYMNWQSIFLVNIPLGIVAIWRTMVVLPYYDSISKQKFDFVGAGLFFVALVVLLIGFHYGPEPTYGWGHPLVFGFIIAGIFGLGLFIMYERSIDQPMLALYIFKNRAFTSAVSATLIAFTALGAHLFVFPFFLQQILHYSAKEAGLMLLSSTITLSIMSPIGGILGDKFGAKNISTLGLILVATGLLLLSPLNHTWQWTDIFWRLSTLAFGFSIFQSPNSTAALNNAPAAQRGIASSMVSFNRNLGTIFGVAFGAALWYTVREHMIGSNTIQLEDWAIQTPGMTLVYYCMAALVFVAAVISYTRDSAKG